jgi:hypothetical protein
MISVNVSSSDTDDEDKRLTVDLTQCVHVAIAEAFGCEKWQIVQRVMFGDIDVLEGETFEDHGLTCVLQLQAPSLFYNFRHRVTPG